MAFKLVMCCSSCGSDTWENPYGTIYICAGCGREVTAEDMELRKIEPDEEN